MLFQFVPGAFHIDILPGRAPVADLKACRGMSLGVLAEAGLKNSRQVSADWAIHTYAPPAFCRTNHSLDAVVVQNMPAISIEAIRESGRECSRVKSSTKVSLPAHDLSGLISEEPALWACPAGLNGGCLLLRLAG